MKSLIVAIGVNGVIGKGNDLPWHYPEDLKYFKRITTGHPVFMGYNTFLSIYNRIGKPLPNRTNYVLTYCDTLPGGAIPVKSIDELPDEEVFIIGGKMVYEMMLPVCDRLYITHIKKEYDGDVFFPTIDYSKYNLIRKEEHEELDFCVYEKKTQ